MPKLYLKIKKHIKDDSALTKEDHKWLRQLVDLASKGKCLRAHVGCIAVKDGKKLVEKTNDYHKIYNCNEIGCIRDIRKVPSGMQREVCYGLCAEQYMFAECAKEGISLKGATIYVGSHPCRICESMVAESGIKKVVFVKGYPDLIPEYDILPDYGIEVIQAAKYIDVEPYTI